MLALVADTHRTEDAGLVGRTATAVDEAEALVHAGDFTTPAVHAAFEEAAAGADARLYGVHGNSDGPALRERLPASRTVEALDRRFVVVHGHEHDRTALSLLARQEDADCVVVGHTHRPGIGTVGDVTLVNPGSHADPRGGPATHGEVRRRGETVAVAIVGRDGDRRAIGQV